MMSPSVTGIQGVYIVSTDDKVINWDLLLAASGPDCKIRCRFQTARLDAECLSSAPMGAILEVCGVFGEWKVAHRGHLTERGSVRDQIPGCILSCSLPLGQQ